ncbi:MAG: hypothetical protein A3B10_00785 [Candidatus Doudnabacteria bacterium RIFCSPLOWO2_01_FULL_44_21]|uniref:PDZ domain-containing protein n=1 Tax=Candidatus Doudnabacteria bacterium RIFCSPLOWO2_01_FULL_44_21 TaxID=1817841 RepID=A0A1F5PXN5_9BACT|nr:MAG: hypothetical protein A3B95_00645 [Candidatus Doudnabacteria bacterium RIFCSPHIGHO2_02_FULL_43_13b]OGE94673.1 MAG: hypothetical protein A3B10_00785 [Candidatus Doudnabacteria bacterium RIFCSPLOWO2_01_FULL_44_21]
MDYPLETNFPETPVKNKKIKLYTILVVLFLVVFGLGFFTGRGQIKLQNGKIEITKGDQPATSADYSLLWDALNILNNKYVDRPLDQQELMYGAVAGLIQAARDPYTVFFDPKEAKSFAEELKGSFDGIGAEIGIKDEQLVIIAPLDDTPAQRANLRAGDAIIAINDEGTVGMTTDQAVSKIRGKAGSQVILTIIHKGETKSEEIKITRAKIVINSVKFSSKEISGQKIAVIKINRFGDDTKGLLDHDIDQAVSGDYAGLILDLRNNPGGYLETAVTTASNWVDDGWVVLKEVAFNNAEKIYKAEGVPRLKGMKTVVLINVGSASASEIVAGALQDYKLATLVGEKTFGKGSVQELENLRDDSQLKITVAKWFTPKGRGIDKTGLEPDVLVELTADDAQNKRDPQMDKALELLK